MLYFFSWMPAHSTILRATMGLIGSFFIAILFGAWFIKKGSKLLLSQARQYTPKSLRTNKNPPTMGGIFIIAAVGCTVLLWSNLFDPLVWILLLCLLFFCAIGAWDDWKKIKTGKGISSKVKFLLQLMGASFIYWLFSVTSYATTTVSLPFLIGDLDVGLLFPIWFMFVLIGTSNAVNLTDGLDGLAIHVLIPNLMVFSLISYFAGITEVALIGMMLVGSSLGFLWYNAYPAQIVMGDAGSLALGAGLGLIALMTKHELLLVLSGALLVVETLSVILQVISYKLTGKRVFLMSPIHHHFELVGWPESKIATRFGIISTILCLLALGVV